jgi:hypothetical protein
VASSQRHASYTFIRDPPRTPAKHTRRRASTPYEHTMKGRRPFSRKTTHDGEASGSASRGRDQEWDRERDRRRMPPPRQLRLRLCVLLRNGWIHAAPRTRRGHRVHGAPLRDRVYVSVKLPRQLYADGEPVPWPDVNLPVQWHLNSRRVPVPPVPRDGRERRRCALLPMDRRRDPAFDIGP